jgi:hypothetical protein
MNLSRPDASDSDGLRTGSKRHTTAFYRLGRDGEVRRDGSGANKELTQPKRLPPPFGVLISPGIVNRVPGSLDGQS